MNTYGTWDQVIFSLPEKEMVNMFIYDVKETMNAFAIMHNNTTKRELTIH